MSDFLNTATGYLEYIYGSLSFLSARYSELYWNILATFIISVFVFTTGMLWKLGRILWALVEKATGNDRYGTIYGSWRFYRITAEKSSDTILEAEIRIKKSFFKEHPRAIFNTPHVPSVRNSIGKCKIVSANIFFIFNTDDASNRIEKSPFIVSVINGDNESIKVKYGSFCGVSAADGKIYYGTCLISKSPVDSTQIKAILSKTKKISRDDAVTAIRKL